MKKPSFVIVFAENLAKIAKKSLKNAINLILPNRCLSCNEIIDEEAFFCASHFKDLQFISNPKCKICSHPFEFVVSNQEMTCVNCLKNRPFFDEIITIYRYNEVLQKAILGLKYYDAAFLAKKFAQILRGKIVGQDFDLIVAVPLHKKRLKERKFNQAVLICGFLKKWLKLGFYADFLVRKKYKKAQAKLKKNERETNLRGLFEVNGKYRDFVKGKNILLVDDVMTTGATLNECAKVLKKAGAKHVVGLVVAKTIFFSSNK